MADPNDSILDTTKLQLGVDPMDDSFDVELMLHINSTFFILNQLGVGPEDAFMITSRENKWTEFIGPNELGATKTLMGLRVKLYFDPPATGPGTEAIERQITQLEWRLNIQTEGVRWLASQQTYVPATA